MAGWRARCRYASLRIGRRRAPLGALLVAIAIAVARRRHDRVIDNRTLRLDQLVIFADVPIEARRVQWNRNDQRHDEADGKHSARDHSNGCRGRHGWLSKV